MSVSFFPPKQKGKIAVAFSGGVDSTYAALTLLEKGYDVFAVTMQLMNDPSILEKARSVAEKIGIRHETVHLEGAFKSAVIDPFVTSYAAGITPSPCILCNRRIKFGVLVENALALGATYMATGHYARMVRAENGEPAILKALDARKDQSYFLMDIPGGSLARLVFPLGEEKKDEIVKRLPESLRSKESQDICFIESDSYKSFLKQKMPSAFKEGNIVDEKGVILGRHEGIMNYTVGQRKGLGIGGGPPLFVKEIRARANEIVVSEKEGLSAGAVYLENVNLLTGLPECFNADVKLRSRHTPVPARIEIDENLRGTVSLKAPAYGIAKGQGCAFYDGDRLLGGGFITGTADVPSK